MPTRQAREWAALTGYKTEARRRGNAGHKTGSEAHVPGHGPTSDMPGFYG